MFHLLPKGKVEKTAGFPIAPHCPHNYIKILTDRLIDFAQTCPVPLASGHREPPASLSIQKQGVVSFCLWRKFLFLLDCMIDPHNLVSIVGDIGFCVFCGITSVLIVADNFSTSFAHRLFHNNHQPFLRSWKPGRWWKHWVPQPWPSWPWLRCGQRSFWQSVRAWQSWS